MPPTSEEILARIDKNLGNVLGSQAEADARIKELGESNDALMTRIKTQDERIEKQDTFMANLEAEANKHRFDVGSGDRFCERDALVSAMPEKLKKWIPFVRALRGGVPVAGQEGMVEPVLRNHAAARLAQKDPETYVAVGGWFMARIQAQLANQSGQPILAEQYNKEAEALSKAMGGTAYEGILTKADLAEDVGGTGGFTVPVVTEAMIGWIIRDASIVRASSPTIVQMRTKVHELPKLANNFTVTWETEGTTIVDSAPATPFSQPSITAQKQAGMVTLSIELIADNIINLMDFIMTHLINVLGRDEDTQMITGTGTPFTGFESAITTNVVTKTPAPLASGDMINLIYDAEQAALVQMGSALWCHPWIIRDEIKLSLAAGNSAYMPFVIGSNVRAQNLHGIPTYASSVIPRTSGAGTESFVYSGPPQYLVIGDRLGTTFDVNPWAETEFKAGQVLLRMMRRVGFVVWVEEAMAKHHDIQLT